MKTLAKRIINSFKRNNPVLFIFFKVFKPTLKFSAEDLSSYYLYSRNEMPFTKYKTAEFEPKINTLFNEWSGSKEFEYLIHYTKKCVIEPNFGWILNTDNNILERSLPYAETGITPFPHYIFYKIKKYIHLGSAVSIQYNWFNYWHFCNDVIGQLYLLDKLKFDKKIPIVVPAKALTLSYVKDFFETDYAKQWNWFFQEADIFIRLNSVYLCKSIPNIKDHFIYVNTIFSKRDLRETDRQIFITRNTLRGRNIMNTDEITSLLRASNFEIIDCDSLTMKEQATLFSSAAVIMGIHGAGLTNMLFRYPQTCKIIEIFPPDCTPGHYYWLAKELGFTYTAFTGNSGDRRSFAVDVNLVRKVVKNL